jgi:hypothetical protein
MLHWVLLRTCVEFEYRVRARAIPNRLMRLHYSFPSFGKNYYHYYRAKLLFAESVKSMVSIRSKICQFSTEIIVWLGRPRHFFFF